MPHIATDDGRPPLLRGGGVGFIRSSSSTNSPGDYRSYEPQLRYFARRYRCVAFNARGYPPSDVPKDWQTYSQERARDDIRAVLDGLNIPKAHIVGISMGGFATLHFGFAYPDRASSLVVAGCGYGATARQAGAIRRGDRAHRGRHRREGHARDRQDLRCRADPRAAPEQGPARLRRVSWPSSPSIRRPARPTRCAACKAAARHCGTSSTR